MASSCTITSICTQQLKDMEILILLLRYIGQLRFLQRSLGIFIYKKQIMFSDILLIKSVRVVIEVRIMQIIFLCFSFFISIYWDSWKSYKYQ